MSDDGVGCYNIRGENGNTTNCNIILIADFV